MIAVSWIYIIHGIFLVYFSLKIAQQLFSLKLAIKDIVYFISALLVIISNLVFNGVATNLNMQVLLFRYDSYGFVLENDFVQYTSLIIVMGFLYFLLRFFKIKIVDIARYN